MKTDTSIEITIGTDPELICYDDKKEELVHVAHTVPNRNAEFGADGHGYIAELRPPPTVSPLDLTERVRISLMKGFEHLGFAKWMAGPWLYEKPMGGHIHFGIDPTDSMIDALDHQLGILLALVEPCEAAKTRRTNVFIGHGGYLNNQNRPYGLLSDFKKKPYGFEYRTPSSFIVTPSIATGIFSLAKAIVYEEAVRGECSWSKLPLTTRKKLAFRKTDFNNCNRDVFLKKLDALWPIVRRMDYFKKGMEGRPLWSKVQSLLQTVKKDGFPDIKDIKPKWKISATTVQEAVKNKLLTISSPDAVAHTEFFALAAIRERYDKYLRNNMGRDEDIEVPRRNLWGDNINFDNYLNNEPRVRRFLVEDVWDWWG